MHGWLRRNAIYAVLAGSVATSALIAQELILPRPEEGGVVQAQGKIPAPSIPPLPPVPPLPPRAVTPPRPPVPPVPPLPPQPSTVDPKTQPPVVTADEPPSKPVETKDQKKPEGLPTLPKAKSDAKVNTPALPPSAVPPIVPPPSVVPPIAPPPIAAPPIAAPPSVVPPIAVPPRKESKPPVEAKPVSTPSVQTKLPAPTTPEIKPSVSDKVEKSPFTPPVKGTPVEKPSVNVPPPFPTAPAQSDVKPAPTPRGQIVPTLPTASSVLGQDPEKINMPAAAPKVEEPKSAWLDHPIVHYLPKSGNFFMLPTGPGYYSALDVVTHEFRDKAPKYAYPPFLFYTPSFFDADFRYVDQPGSNADFFERLHRIHLGDDWMFATGGQAWYRYMNETDSRLSGTTNNYDQFRARVFGDIWYKDRFRVYAEFITAQTFNEDLPPLKIDVNRADLLNLFFDLKIAEWECNPIYVRAGRQELNLGSQRLLSSLDWANTRRTFEGVRGFMVSEKLDIDVFYVKPVIIDPVKFDYTDRNQNFAGAWVTYKPQKGQAIDLYYMYLDNHNYTSVMGIQTFPLNIHTFGSRVMGDKDGFLWDFEGAFQFGNANKDTPVRAGMATAGVGYNAKDLPLNPTLWAYYDWASGDPTPNSGNFNTFNPLFPFGHYYMGFLDIVGRQNIRDANLHLYLYPLKWITFNVQYHNFQLDRAADALYNVALTPLRRSLNSSAGGIVGQEIDFLVNFHLGKHSDIVLGYSKLWAGEFIYNTGNGQSPELFYAMYSFRW